jgi:hypothetical protein
MVETTIYLHSSKESNYHQAKELMLSKEDAYKFAYVCYEVGIRIKFDEETGEAVATHLNGVELKEPVKV